MNTEMQQKMRGTMGPVDFLIVRFPGNKFTGKIAPELRRLERTGLIKIIDLLFISKDSAGNIESFEIEDLGDAAKRDYGDFIGNVGGWLSQEDVESIGDDLPLNSSAGAILYENVWAAQLKQNLMEADAEVISTGRIPAELIDMAMEQSRTNR